MAKFEHTPTYPFAPDKTHLVPGLFLNSSEKRPFSGFKFLEGTVLLAEGASMFEDRRLICLTRAIFGQSNLQIAVRLTNTFEHTSKKTVTNEMTEIYKMLGLSDRSTKRPLLFPACLAMNIFGIPENGHGNQNLYPIPADMRLIMRGVARGLTDKAISRDPEVNLSKSAVSSRLNKFGENIGFFGRELHILATLVTNHYSLDQIWPPDMPDLAEISAAVLQPARAA